MSLPTLGVFTGPSPRVYKLYWASEACRRHKSVYRFVCAVAGDQYPPSYLDIGMGGYFEGFGGMSILSG